MKRTMTFLATLLIALSAGFIAAPMAYATVSTTSNKTVASGDGLTTSFNFSFAVRSSADLTVIYTDSAGTQTTISPSLYTVTLTTIPAGQLWASGGTVTYPKSGSAIASGTTLTILRTVGLTQTTSLINQGGYYPSSIEQALDLATMQAQQLNELANRSVAAPSTDTNISMTLPAAAARANSALCFDASGNAALCSKNTGAVTSSPATIVQQNIAALKGVTGMINGAVVQVAGYYTYGDGGGGLYYWNASDTTTDNGGTVIASTTGGTGRWNRIYDTWINVRWFGAHGDSASDDTTMIVNALAALPSSGGVIYFPPGTYKTTSTITLKQNVALRGAGQLVSTIAPTTAVTTDVFDYEPGVLQTGAIEISSMGFSGNATTLRAIHLKNLTDVTINRIYVDGFSNASAIFVLFDNVEASQIRDSVFLNAKNYAVKLTNASNANILEGNSFTAAAAGGGVFIDIGVTQPVIIGNNFEGASLGNIGIAVNGTIATSITGNFFEFWTGAAIAANSGSAMNLTIRDNHIHATAGAAQMVALNSGSGTNDRIIAENNYLALLGNGGTSAVGFDFGSSTNIWARSNRSGGAGTGIVRVNGVTQTLPDYMPFVGAPLDVRAGRRVQSPAYAATLTVDAANGEYVFPSALTGNITIGAPSNPLTGQELIFNFIQNGVGGFTVTWNAVFTHVLWSDVGNAANTNASARFVYDGASWRQVSGQRVWN